MIIDMQVHLWEADRPDRPWVPGFEPSLPEPLTAEDFLPRMDEAGVDRVIICPVGMRPFNSEYQLECAARYPNRFGVQGTIDPLAPDVEEKARGWLAQPGMLGMRVGLRKAQRDQWPSDRAADPLWSAAERYGVPVTVMVPGSVKYAGTIAERFPDLRLSIDHLGLPLIDEGFEYPEFEDMLQLARTPRVVVKLSTLTSRTLLGYPFTEVHDLLRRAYDAYGPMRLLWGTDHTQNLGRDRVKSYTEEVDLIRKAVDFLSDEDKEWILGRAAAEYLGWPEGVPSTALATSRHV